MLRAQQVEPRRASEASDHAPGPVVVTGAANGIGLAVARLVSAEGAGVAMLDRDADAVDRAAAGVRRDARDSKVVAVGCDVADDQQVTRAFDEAIDGLGSLGGLVCAAGIDRGAPFDELEPAVWDEVMDVNLRGTFLSCRAAVRHMLQARGGSIVCVSSPLAFVGTAGGAGAYCASKGGVSALVRALAVEYADRGIRVNALLPGPTETRLMWANAHADEVPKLRRTIRGEVPLGRLADPQEPARAALWLLSDAASYVTGAQLACDGGVLAKASVSV
jgi:NAD(P)-dependent dehydrogenase (short-subunit alcohol dehydrogenase family)